MNDTIEYTGLEKRLRGFLKSKPWLLPFLVYVSRNPMGTISDVSRILGVRSSIVRRALWWLSKIGVVSVSREGDKRYYRVAEDAINLLDEITRNTRYYNRNYVLKINGEYIVVRVKRNRIIPYTIPASIVDTVERVLRNAPNQEFTLNDLVFSTNISPRLLVLALRVLKILDRIEKSEAGYLLKTRR